MTTTTQVIIFSPNHSTMYQHCSSEDHYNMNQESVISILLLNSKMAYVLKKM